MKIVNEEVGKLSDPKFPNLEHREIPNGESKQEMSELDFGRGVVLSTNGRERKSSFSRSGNALGRPRNFTERSNANPRRRKDNECWICGKVGHMSFNCFKGFCQKCGKRGHLPQDCNAKNVLTSGFANSADCHRSDSVFIHVKLDSVETLAMLDSGAQPSMLDIKFVKENNITFVKDSSFVQGLASNPVQECGTTEILVDIGEGHMVKQRSCIIIGPEPIVILGRDSWKSLKSQPSIGNNTEFVLGPSGSRCMRRLGETRYYLERGSFRH